MRVNLRDTSSTFNGTTTSTKPDLPPSNFRPDDNGEGMDTLTNNTLQQAPAGNEFNALKHWLRNVAQHKLLSKVCFLRVVFSFRKLLWFPKTVFWGSEKRFRSR